MAVCGGNYWTLGKKGDWINVSDILYSVILIFKRKRDTDKICDNNVAFFLISSHPYKQVDIY